MPQFFPSNAWLAPIDAKLTQASAVVEGRWPGRVMVQEFGRNGDVDAAEDIWDGGGDYTGFATASELFETYSSSANDTAAGTGARTVRWYYFDANLNAFDANGDWLYFDVTLNGVTGVDSVVSGKRVWSGQVLTAGSGLTNAGAITVRQKVTTANILELIPIGSGNTQTTAFTVPLGYTGYMLQYGASMEDNTANTAIMGIKVITPTGVVQTVRAFVITTTAGRTISHEGGIPFPALTSLVMRATSVTNTNAIITAHWDMMLVKDGT